MILFYAIPSLVIVVGLYNILKYYIKRTNVNYKETIGTVVDYKMRSDSESTTYSSIIEYEVNGSIYRCVEKSSSSFRKRLGKKVKLLYNINNPTDSMSLELSSSIIFICFGIFFIIIVYIMSASKR